MTCSIRALSGIQILFMSPLILYISATLILLLHSLAYHLIYIAYHPLVLFLLSIHTDMAMAMYPSCFRLFDRPVLCVSLLRISLGFGAAVLRSPFCSPVSPAEQY